MCAAQFKLHVDSVATSHNLALAQEPARDYNWRPTRLRWYMFGNKKGAVGCNADGCPVGLYTQLPAKTHGKKIRKKFWRERKTPMKNFTQKALMVVLSVFVLVGLFYGLSTPVKATAATSVNAVTPEPCPADPTDPEGSSCGQP